jgi:hypothetical protein
VPRADVGTSPFVVAEQRKRTILKQNYIINGARSAWSKMKDTYKKNPLKKKLFGGSQ